MKGAGLAAGYSSPLRESQMALTRSRILNALAALIEAGREPTYAAIAELAAVQERTVYRHFPTRDDLHREFWAWIHERHFSVPEPAVDLPSLLAQVSQSFAGFSSREPLARAMLHSNEGRAIRASAKRERRQRFERVVKAEAPELGSAAARRTAAAAQVLSSAMAWEYLRDYWDMDAREAAATVHDALGALLRGVREGRGSSERGKASSRGRARERKSK